MHKGQVREKTPGPANRGKCKSELTATGPHRALEGQHGSGRNGLLPRIQSRAAAVEGRIAAPENVTTALPEDPEIPLCCCAGKIGKQGPEEMSVRPHRQQCSPPLLSHGAARGRTVNTTCSAPAGVGGTQTPAATWADLEDAPLSETSPSRKDKDCRTPIDVPSEGSPNARGSRMAATGMGAGLVSRKVTGC